MSSLTLEGEQDEAMICELMDLGLSLNKLFYDLLGKAHLHSFSQKVIKYHLFILKTVFGGGTKCPPL